MCVISVIDSMDKIPSNKSIDKMAKENPHGNSIAYFDKVTKSIIYHKAIKLKELKKIQKKCIKENNLKIIQHYRIASVGSSDNKYLNHGFKIENGSINDLQGSTNADYLVHNGTMDLNELLQIAKAIQINNPHAIFPKGELSDTLVMSFILNFVDYSFLNHYTDSNRFAIMNGKTGEITTYGNFVNVCDIDNNNQLVTSNDYFTNTYQYQDFFGLKEYSMWDKPKKRITKEAKTEIKRLYDIYQNYFDSEKEIEELIKEYNITDIHDYENVVLDEVDWRTDNEGFEF